MRKGIEIFRNFPAEHIRQKAEKWGKESKKIF